MTDTRWSELYTTYAPSIRRYFQRALAHASPGDAQDLTQETFLRVIARHPLGLPELNPRALLYYVARFVLADHWRRRLGRLGPPRDLLDHAMSETALGPRDEDDDPPLDRLAAGGDPEQAAEVRELGEQVFAAMRASRNGRAALGIALYGYPSSGTRSPRQLRKRNRQKKRAQRGRAEALAQFPELRDVIAA